MARHSVFKREADSVVSLQANLVRNWSAQQQDIFEWFSRPALRTINTGTGALGVPLHLIVRARAGTGKTTIIIEGVNRAPESSIWVCAFNKAIATVLNSRITNPAAEATTIHAKGFAAIRRQWPYLRVAEGSVRGEYLTDTVCAKDTPKPIRRLITLLHTKAREICPTGATPEVLTRLALFFNLEPDEGWERYPLEYVVQLAHAAMAQAAHEVPPRHVGIDFADMIYLPLVHNLLSPEYDLVVVDEAQDMTRAQLTIAQRLCKGRICLVGDDKQAIYGFRMADSGSLDRLKTELGAAELPLTITYRCARSIVRRAQVLVPDIQAAEGNPEGTIDSCDYQELLELAQPGQFILSRLNAPLVSITLQLLKRKKRARMAGRDIGTGIQAVLKKLNINDSTSITAVLTRLEEWESKMVTRYLSHGQPDLVDRCRDQASMIRALAKEAEDVPDLVNRIDWLFVDDPEAGQIMCSSVHKAKGLEAERVYILQESLYRRGVTQEEQNIDYVATTRAKRHMTLVTGVPGLAQQL